MNDSHELDDSVHERITSFCEAGDQLAEAARYEEAIVQYNQAWQWVPNPKNDWEASTWILAAIADAYFLSGFKASAREALEYAIPVNTKWGAPQPLWRAGLLALGCEAAANQTPRFILPGWGARFQCVLGAPMRAWREFVPPRWSA